MQPEPVVINVPIEVCPQHSGVQETLRDHERRLNGGTDRMRSIEEAVNRIEKTLMGRPTWPTTAVISALVGIIMVLATMLGNHLLARTGLVHRDDMPAMTQPAPLEGRTP